MNVRTDLGQRGEHLLLDVPHQAIGRKLQALVDVQLGHMDAHQQPAVARLWRRILVEGGGRMVHDRWEFGVRILLLGERSASVLRLGFGRTL